MRQWADRSVEVLQFLHSLRFVTCDRTLGITSARVFESLVPDELMYSPVELLGADTTSGNRVQHGDMSRRRFWGQGNCKQQQPQIQGME